jgi:hypothetical protein
MSVVVRIIFYLIPFMFAFILYIPLDMVVLDTVIKEHNVYNITTKPYCLCAIDEPPSSQQPFTDGMDVCNTFCIHNATCQYTYTIYSFGSNFTEGVCELFDSPCPNVVCSDPFAVGAENLAYHTMGQKQLQGIIKKI